MKILKIASESTGQLYEINKQITSLKTSFETAKANLDEQYLPQIKTLEQQRNFLIMEVAREDDLQMQQIQQQQVAQQQTQPVAPVTPAPTSVAPPQQG